MKRREFIESMTAALVAAGAGVRTSAQAGYPKVMLFGFTVISKKGNGIVATMPKIGNHETFLAGPAAAINALGKGLNQTAVKGANSGLEYGHDDLGARGTTLLCLKATNATIGDGSSAATTDRLDPHVPKMSELASSMKEGVYRFATYPEGSLTLEFNGGVFKMPGTRTNSPGVQDVRWQFQRDGKDVGKVYKLTDLLVFHSSTSQIDVSFGGTKITLTAGQQLWFINVPTVKEQDTDAMTIEHAHEWFELLTPAVGGKIQAVAKDKVEFKTVAFTFKHPCAKPIAPPKPGEQPKVRYFPPDTDPCFIVAE